MLVWASMQSLTPEVVVCEYMEAMPANEVAEVFHGQVNCKKLPIESALCRL